MKDQRMRLIPYEQWGHIHADPTRIEVWKNNKWLAQIFRERDGQLRVSVNHVAHKKGIWRDGITWDHLMEVKRQIGHADSYAVEVLPRDRDIMNVANMRHFWILPQPVCGWSREEFNHA